MKPPRTVLFWILSGAVFAYPVHACSIVGSISNLKLVDDAEMIIRAKAVEYASPPSNPRMWTTGVPDSRIRFNVIERIRGAEISELILPGYLVDRDDFNDQEPPYTFVRPGGRGGSCFANSYRTGGQFLLFLKKGGNGELTVNWYALAPVNEQLHSDDDPWILWVRERAKRVAGGTSKSETKPRPAKP
ncbi:MAG TPA: hypothetical protein VKR61_03185 [Bryobacteraceae bacterium]|nr:hypothetical protein [Bryobacteraceae bacterium]